MLSSLRHFSAALWILSLLVSPAVLAQQSAADAATNSDPEADTAAVQQARQQAEREAKFKQLDYIQDVLSQKIAERSSLGTRIEAANEQDKDDLRRQADDLTDDIRQLRQTLESIAIGGVDTSLFVPQEVEEESDWRQDVALIAQPVIDTLKDLTEKPRKLKELNDQIDLYQQELSIASEALGNLAPAMAMEPTGDLESSLTRLQKLWEGRRNDAQNATEIARFQIADLQGDQPITATIYNSLISFMKGRGLTILMAVAAASTVYFGVRFLLRGYRASLVDNHAPESRTRYRLAAYSVQALTFVLILIAIFVVFYQRGDVLLLGLLILLIIGLALSIRQLLPQYISEARLLLNIGAMREGERIQYRGLPWRVESINMNTVLRNPELHGVLRIPLAEFHGMTSRPSGKDSWFPTSRGDVVLLENETLLEVVDQNPDTVELKRRGGQIISTPASDFYSRDMVNLTRGGTFGVTGVFGIDYEHQDISLSRVPKILRDAIRQALEQTDLHSFVKDVRVELSEANASSIDYWLFVTCDSRAAKSYLRIKRTMQSACIEACTRESLSIPFPHMSIVQRSAVADS